MPKGYAMILAGTATYRGSEPEANSVFAKIPKDVKFTLGLKNPSSYINCQNTDLMAVGDEFPRGVQANPSKSTVAQITIHTDHGFGTRSTSRARRCISIPSQPTPRATERPPSPAW